MNRFLTFILVVIPFVFLGQTKVSGVVLSEENSPIANAILYFDNPTDAVRTNAKGAFTIESLETKTELFAEAPDFELQVVDLVDKDLSDLKVVLKESQILKELVIVAKPKVRLKKKENPAYTLLKKVWKNEYRVGLSNYDYYQYQKKEYLKLGMNNVDTMVSNFLLDNPDAEFLGKLKGKDKNHLEIPLFLTTEQSLVYGKNKGRKEQVSHVTDEVSKGVLQDGFAFERILKSMKTFDVYENTFEIGDKRFTSPIASYGYSAYLYQLTDTIKHKNKTYYRVHFFPRIDEDLALQGDFLVYDSLYVLKSIRLYNTPKTNVNFVRNIFFEKEYETVDNKYAVLSKDSYYTDYTVGSLNPDDMGMFIQHDITYSNFKFNSRKPDDFYKNFEKNHKKGFLSDLQENKIADNSDTSVDEGVIQTMRDNPKVQRAIDFLDFIGNGYFSVAPCLELGSLWDLIGLTKAEGFRMRLGMRTFCSNNDRFRTYAYTAYGFKDKRMKYGVSAQYLLNTEPRILLGGIYVDDNEIPATNLDIPDLSQFRMTTKYITFFARGNNYNILRNKTTKFLVDYAPHDNLHFNLSATHKIINSALPEIFDIGYFYENKTINTITDFNVDLNFTYTPNRNVYGKGVEQRYGKNLFSRYSLSLSKSFSGVMNSVADFYKVQTTINYPLTVFNLGTLDIGLNAGKTFGKVPLVLTPSIAANQTYSYVPRTFSLLDTYDFVTDTYVNLFFEHHFNGFVFNKIPLTRKYKLRLVTFANMAYGTISDENKALNRSSIQYHAPSDKLYWEYGFGVENIGFSNFRPFRVDFILRNQYKDINAPASPMWGVRVKILPEF